MHTLVIEKDEQIGRILCDIFNDYYFTCKVITNLKEAATYLKTFNPDVLVLDVFSDRDISILKEVNTNTTKVIVTSTAIKNAYVKCDYFLLKPFNFNELEDIIFKIKKAIDKKSPIVYIDPELLKNQSSEGNKNGTNKHR